MKYSMLIVILALAACARNDYVALPGNQLSKEDSDAALKQCRHDALVKYHDGQSIIGVLVGGAAGGAIGGAIGGAAFGAGTEGSMKISDLKPYIVNCMREKGFVGTTD